MKFGHYTELLSAALFLDASFVNNSLTPKNSWKCILDVKNAKYSLSPSFLRTVCTALKLLGKTFSVVAGTKQASNTQWWREHSSSLFEFVDVPTEFDVVCDVSSMFCEYFRGFPPYLVSFHCDPAGFLFYLRRIYELHFAELVFKSTSPHQGCPLFQRPL